MNLKSTPIRLLEEEDLQRRKDTSRRKDLSRYRESSKSPGHVPSNFNTRRQQSEFNPSLYLKPNFNEEDIIAIKEAFDAYDSNGSGLLTPNDLKVALFHQGFHATKETVYNIMAEYDEDCLGGVSFSAFMKIISGQPTQSQNQHQIKRAFRKLDRDNKGYIDRKDVSNLLKNLGQMWQQSDLEIIFQKLDEKEANRITYQLFKKIMHSPLSMY